MASPAPDLYAVLGVPRSATPAEIRAAYLALVSRYHPDRHAGNPLSDLAGEKLAELNRAYEVLSDPGRRAAYDATLAPAAPGRAPGRRPSLLRVVLLAFGLLLALRFGAVLLRALGRALAALQGTPALLALTIALLVAGIAFLIHRRRRKQRWSRVSRPASPAKRRDG